MSKSITNNILLAGFGGQGILFAGKLLATAGLLEDRQVSWLPSYGPEMRGGTANCSVIISDDPIGSPVVSHPDVLIVMNLPSLDKFEADCPAGAKVFIDESLILRKPERTDLNAYYIPAARLAEENGLSGLANMIMIGKVIRETGACSYDAVIKAMAKSIPDRKRDLHDCNLKALDVGFSYTGESV